MHDITQQIKEKAYHLGFLEVGICSAETLSNETELLNQWLDLECQGTMDWMVRTREIRGNPRHFFQETKSIIVVADNYFRPDESVIKPTDEGNISIYARGRDYHKILRNKLKLLLVYIQELIPDAKGRICVDSFPIMEKPLAVRAGIGWIGKHTNLIIKGKGSYFFLGEILLSKELPHDEPLTADYCGNCNKCQIACPTDALNQAYVLDSNKCISYLTIEHDGEIDSSLRDRMENWIFGCDICQEICPWNRFSANTGEPEYSSKIPAYFLKLENLIELTREDYDRLFEGTPVKRSGFDNFKRNVRIALENSHKKSVKPIPRDSDA
jgi:epoxyqueuosine reductase